jgi:hypothetical protein
MSVELRVVSPRGGVAPPSSSESVRSPFWSQDDMCLFLAAFFAFLASLSDLDFHSGHLGYFFFDLIGGGIALPHHKDFSVSLGVGL